MDLDGIDEGMEDMDEGIDDLPLFADAEVRKIDSVVKEKAQKLDKIHAAVQDMSSRLKTISAHANNVAQEVQTTDALVSAKKAEIQSEKHMAQMVNRALAKAKIESKSAQEELMKVQEQLSALQNNIHKATQGMDEHKMKMNWNQGELEQWAVAAKQKEEDNLSLQKYQRADEVKVKESNLQVESLGKDLVQKKAELENEITETKAKQMELDRIAEEFRETHKERQQLVSQWQETIEAMKARDAEINDIGERYAKAKAEREVMVEKVEGQRKRLEAQQTENKEVEARAELLRRIVSKKRDEMGIDAAKLEDFKQELDGLKNALIVSSEKLMAKRAEIQNVTQDLENRTVQLERERTKLKIAKENYELKKLKAKDADHTAKSAEDELARLEKDLLVQTSLLKDLKEELFRESQHVHDLKQEESQLRTEIAGCKTAARNLDAQLTQLDKEAGRQQELLYNAEFQIQQIERKIARGLGERSDEEKLKLKQQIEDLEQTLQGAKEKTKMLTGQTRKLQNEIVLSRGRKEELVKKNISMAERINELDLENQSVEEEIRRFNKMKEEEMVLQDVLKLEVRRLRDLLAAKTDAVFSLENRRQQLMISMEERKQEIAVHNHVLKVELRTAEEEKHAVTLDLRGREVAVERLKAKYTTAQQARGDGDGQSQTYFLIQAAQKREALQRTGDEMDAEIRKCEREIRGLQTTLDHLNARNTAYRNSFQKVDTGSSEGEQLRQLEERAKLAKEGLFRKKKELQRLVTDWEEDSRRLEQVKTQTEKILRQREHLEGAKDQVNEELLGQQEQLADLANKLEVAVRRQRDKAATSEGGSVTTMTIEEKSAKAEVLRDVTQNVLYTLGQLAMEFPEVSAELSQRLQEADLKVPTKPPSKTPTASIAQRASRKATSDGPMSARSQGSNR